MNVFCLERFFMYNKFYLQKIPDNSAQHTGRSIKKKEGKL